MVAACSLKSQRNNRQNALAADSVDGKAGEKGCIFTVLWRWNNRIYDRAFSCKGKGVATTNDCRFSEGCVIENGWCFIFWNSKEITNKIPQSQSPPAEILEKKHIFSIYCWNKNNRVLWQSLSEKPKRQPIKRLTHKVTYSRLKNGKLKKSA